MATTIIDALIVTLGLDASKFKKGREQAEAETERTQRKVKENSEGITKSLMDVGKTISGLFLGFETASGFAKWLGALNTGEAALGRTAKTVNMSAHELNMWGKAVELAGGNATDAQGAFSQLTEDFQKFSTGAGDPSALINLLQARGVQIRDENGQLRDQGTIFEELADKTAQYGAAYQATMFKQVGLTKGYIDYLVQAPELRAKDRAEAEAHNAVTDDSVKQAQELQKYWRDIGQKIEAAGQLILTAVTPAFEQLLDVFADVNAQGEEFQTGLKLVGTFAIGLKRIFSTIGDSIGGAAAALVAAAHGDFKGAWAILQDQSARSDAANDKAGADIAKIWSDDVSAAKQAQVVAQSGVGAAAVAPSGKQLPKGYRYNNPGNILDSQGRERHYDSPEEGEEALEKDLRIKIEKHGLKTVDALIRSYEGNDTKNNDIPAYIKDVQKRLGTNDINSGDIKSIAKAIRIHENGYDLPTGATPGATVASANAPKAGNTTTVQVDAIHVNAPNANPAAVAGEVGSAIQRKISVAQSDSGQS